MEDHKRAKLQELANWKSQQVYVEEEDRGQRCLSVRWVLTPKMIDNVVSTKARLCARRFEENQDFCTDSPTCSRIRIRFALTIISSFSWCLNSIDVKTAFLQGKEMECTVYLRPPKRLKQTKFGGLRSVFMGWLMQVDIGICMQRMYYASINSKREHSPGVLHLFSARVPRICTI